MEMDKKVKGLEIEVTEKGIEKVREQVESLTSAVDRLRESVERLRDLGVIVHIDGVSTFEE